MPHEMDEITEFVFKETLSKGDITEKTTLDDLGLYGDDYDEFISKYSSKFKVDMSNHLWYFHTKEEPSFNLGSVFFKPPHKRVERINITIKILKDCVKAGKWLFEYPEHSLPKRRYDIIATYLIFLLLAGGVVAGFFISAHH